MQTPFRIAHLSDVHILSTGRRPPELDLRTRVVSFGRSLDAPRRAAQLRRALQTAAGADHIVISGDLTELGTPAQFETLAEGLHESGIEPDRCTLVPGNHDAYSRADAWRRALEGPLARYRGASADEDGKVIERAGLFFMPLDVACHQSVTRSAAELGDAAAHALERRLFDLGDVPVVIAMHHPPFPHASRPWQWIDGLRGHARLVGILARYPNAHVLHGHAHARADRAIRPHDPSDRARVFGAAAIVDDRTGTTHVREYDLVDGVLIPREARAIDDEARFAA